MVIMTMVAIMILAMTIMVIIAVIGMLEVLRGAGRVGMTVRSLGFLRNRRRL
jgi:hypothetical protein